MVYPVASANHTHASCFPAQTITHSYAQLLLPGGIDGCSSLRAVMHVRVCRWRALFNGRWLLQVWKTHNKWFPTRACVLQRCSWAKSWCFRTLGGFSCRHSRRIVRKLPASRSTTTIELWYSTCMCTHRWTHRCTHMPPADVEAHSEIQWGLELWRAVLRWDCGIKIANWKC